MYCDACNNAEPLKHDAGFAKTAREAVGLCIAYALRDGFKRTRKGWLCPACQKPR